MNRHNSGTGAVRTILCYAEGHGEQWEGFCLDFDLAVQGSSFDDVIGKLREQAELYLEGVRELPEADRARLFHRSVPWFLRVRLGWRGLWAAIRAGGDGHGRDGIIVVPTGLAMA